MEGKCSEEAICYKQGTADPGTSVQPNWLANPAPSVFLLRVLVQQTMSHSCVQRRMVISFSDRKQYMLSPLGLLLVVLFLGADVQRKTQNANVARPLQKLTVQTVSKPEC